jgi:hypothetical protein
MKIITGIFWALVAIAVVLAILILAVPQAIFFDISNYLQIATAIGGALVLFFMYYRTGKQDHILYASGALGLWGLANIAWYVNFLLGRRAEVFPGLIDMAMIASILILGIALQHAFPRKQVMPHILLGVLALILITPVAIIITTGMTSATLVTLLYFFACASLLVTGLNHSLRNYPVIFAGAILFAVCFMIYPVRELFFLSFAPLSVIGTFVIAGFSLIVIGLIGAGEKSGTA